MLNTYAERIKYAMKVRGISQKELVDKTGLNKGTISSYLNDKYNPKQNAIFLISKALDVSEVWLMGLTDDMEVPQSRKVYLWLNDVIENNDTQIINIISKLSKLERSELLMIESIIDTYLNKK